MIATTLRSTLLLAAPLLFVVACSEGGSGKASAAHEGSTATAGVVAAATSVHGVKCGCAIKEIDACGNYIEVDGKYVALETPEVMSPMAFCGKDGLRAKVEGKVENDVFVATSFALEP